MFVGVDVSLNEFVSLGTIIKSRNNGTQQLLFIEPFVTFTPIENTNISIANIIHQGSPVNHKLTIQTELGNTFGLTASVVNPWRFGKYYDTNMIHASLGMYLRFLRE